jgi:hypothetical protein
VDGIGSVAATFSVCQLGWQDKATIRGEVLNPTTASSVSLCSGVPVPLRRVDASESRAGLRESRRADGDGGAERAEWGVAGYICEYADASPGIVATPRRNEP